VGTALLVAGSTRDTTFSGPGDRGPEDPGPGTQGPKLACTEHVHLSG